MQEKHQLTPYIYNQSKLKKEEEEQQQQQNNPISAEEKKIIKTRAEINEKEKKG